MAFTQNSLHHCMYNSSDEDLVYLMSGSRSDIDVCNYPKLNRRMYRENGKKTFVDLDRIDYV